MSPPRPICVTNVSEPGTEAPGPQLDKSQRFIIETFIISVSVLINILGLIIVKIAQGKRKSAYNILYYNLAISNILACPATWLCNNLVYIFSDDLNDAKDNGYACRVAGYEVIGVYVALAVGIQMTFAMIGLTVQQFILCKSVGNVRASDYVLQKKKALGFIGVSGFITLICIFVPFTEMMVRTDPARVSCTPSCIVSLFEDTISIANVLAGLITLQYVTISVFAALVHSASKHVSDELRAGQIHATTEENWLDIREAFRTTMILLLSLTLFFIPFTIYFIVQLNLGGVEKVSQNVAIFYLTMMPCAKCIFDPFIYIICMGQVMQTALDSVRRCCGRSWDVGRSGSDPVTPSGTNSRSQGETNLCDTQLSPDSGTFTRTASDTCLVGK